MKISNDLLKGCTETQIGFTFCQLDPNGGDFSTVPADNEILFEEPGTCLIRKPDRWDEWVAYHFGNDTPVSYYDDNDEDGLVNILEYYGDVNITNRRQNSRKRRQIVFEGLTDIDVPIEQVGLDPNNPDTDGDLLTDGFERMFNLDAKVTDEIDADYDLDGLNNLEEQIRSTDPLNADTDGDGVPDGEEAGQGSDPGDSSDNGEPGKDKASVTLTIGDHSGSHSERYILHVGAISHQSPGFGIVGSGTYEFPSGKHTIFLLHQGTNLASPDYDYTAHVQRVAGTQIKIEDPQGYSSFVFRAFTFKQRWARARLMVGGKKFFDHIFPFYEILANSFAIFIILWANLKFLWGYPTQ